MGRHLGGRRGAGSRLAPHRQEEFRCRLSRWRVCFGLFSGCSSRIIFNVISVVSSKFLLMYADMRLVSERCCIVHIPFSMEMGPETLRNLTTNHLGFHFVESLLEKYLDDTSYYSLAGNLPRNLQLMQHISSCTCMYVLLVMGDGEACRLFLDVKF